MMQLHAEMKIIVNKLSLSTNHDLGEGEGNLTLWNETKISTAYAHAAIRK